MKHIQRWQPVFGAGVFAFALSFLVTACQPLLAGDENSGKQNPSSVRSASIHALLTNDLADMARLPAARTQPFDQSHHQVFSEIFGGLSGMDITAYFDKRIHYFVMDSDQLASNVDLDHLPFQGWLQDLQGQRASLLSPELPKAALADDGNDNSDVQLGGQNIGTEFWFMSVVNRTPITIYLNQQAIPMDSSRVGLMRFGSAYAGTLQADNGRVITLPPGFRQGILVHEARHSDCTGGVTESDLDVVRHMTSQTEFTQKFPKMECGHFHSICPPDMKEFAGLAACDDRPWGAYTVGFIYQLALAKTAAPNSDERAILEASALDSFSRLQFDTSAMLSGDDGPPDMTTGGLNRRGEP